MSEEIQKWSTEEIAKLIEIYRRHENLWNPTNLDSKNRVKRIDSYKEIAGTFKKTHGEIERKIKNITSHYNRERRNFKAMKKSGAGQTFRAKLFGYNAMSFLNGKNQPKKGIEIGRRYEECDSSDEPQTSSGPKYSAPIMKDLVQTETTSKVAQQQSDKFKGQQKNRREISESTQVFNLMKSIYDKKQRDEYDTFGEMVAHSIRSLKWEFTKIDVQHDISNLLYEARKSELIMTSPSSLSTSTNTSDNSLGQVEEYTTLLDPLSSSQTQETAVVQLAFDTALGDAETENYSE